MDYLLLKLVHVSSVIIFLGNITTGLFWASRAHQSRDFRLIASTFESIIRSDRWFTIPGVIGILVSGFVLAGMADLPVLGTSWILWPIVLFSVSGIVFGVWVAPLQKRILMLAAGAESGKQEEQSYVSLYRQWEAWGLIAIAAPILALVIMVLKPPLPGF